MASIIGYTKAKIDELLGGKASLAGGRVPDSQLPTRLSQVELEAALQPPVIPVGADPTGVADSTTAIQAAITAALDSNAEVYIPAGTYKCSAAITANSSLVRIRGAGADTTVLSFTGSAYNLLTVGSGAGNQVRPTGYLRDLSVRGPSAAPTSGKAAVVINGLNQFEVTNVQAGNQDIGFDLINNCYGAIFNNIRAGFGGTVNVGVNLRTGPQSGSDITFVNPWVAGRIAGFHCSGGGGGYHLFGGQVAGGMGLSSPNDLAGALILGKDYLTGATGETSVDLHGTSFEGTTFAWILRAFDQAVVTMHGVAANPAVSGSPAIGFYKNSNHKNSRTLLSGTILSGYWSAALLVAIAGSYGFAHWWETGTYSAAQSPSISGVSGYVNSIAEQSGILPSAVVTDLYGVIVQGQRIGPSAKVGRNLYTANEATAVTDATGMSGAGSVTVARDATVAPEPGRDPASFTLTATAAGNGRAKSPAKTITQGAIYRATALALPDTIARNMRLEIDWLTAANAFVSNATPDFVATTVDGWTTLTVTAVAPGGTVAKAQVNIVVSDMGAAGEKFYLTRQSLAKVI